MHRRLKVLLSFLTILLTVSLSAQSITGRVVDAAGKALSAVEVLNSRTEQRVLSDASGQFVISVTTYPVDLLFIDDDYHLHLETLDDVPGGTLSITLKALEVELSEIVISERRAVIYGLRRLRDVEGTAIYAGKKTEVVVLDNVVGNLATNNPRQVFAQVAGLNIYDSPDAGLQLNIGGRGLDPNRTANFNTRQNGYDISADVLGYPESYYTPPAEALAEIQVIRGAASLQYGTQFGGLINFRFKEAPADRRATVTTRQTIGRFGLFNSFNRVAGTSGPLSYQAHVQYKRGDGWRPNSGFESRHAFLQVGYALSSRTRIKAEVTYLDYLAQQPGGLTDAQFEADPTVSIRSRNYFSIDWMLAQVELQHQFSDFQKLSLSVYGLDARRDALGFLTNRVSQVDDDSFGRDLISGEFANVGAEWRYLVEYKLGRLPVTSLVGGKVYISRNAATQGPGAAGAQADFERAVEAFPDYQAQSDFIFPNRNVALFTEHIFRLGRRWTITPGIRLEHIRTASEGSFRRIDLDLAGNPIRDRSFRDDRDVRRTFGLGGIGIAYKPQKYVEWYGNISQNYRSVTFNDIRIVNPTFQVDPDITDERGYTIDVGTRGQLNSMLRYDLGAYLLNYGNRIGEVLRRELTVDINGDPIQTGRVLRTRDNIGDAIIIGFESYLELQLHRLWAPADAAYTISIWSNAALTQSEYIRSEEAGVVGNQIEFVPLYNVKYGLRAGWNNLKLSLQHTLVGSQFTDASNAPRNPADNQSGTIGAIPDYDVWDLSLSYRLRSWSLETGLNNLTDASYFTRRATGYPGPGIIPSEPRAWYLSIGYTW